MSKAPATSRFVDHGVGLVVEPADDGPRQVWDGAKSVLEEGGLAPRQKAKPRAARTEERREQLIACAEAVAKLAKHRDIKPIPVRDVIHDLEIRHVLARIVRRWTTRPSFLSTKTGARERHKEHVVPCRVLVDRMIMKPSDCRELLEKAVIIASVTPDEHKRLGGIYKDFKDLYERMLKEPMISQLPSLGAERYSAVRIALQPKP